VGDNAAYRVFEYQVVNFYDLGILTSEVLDILAEPHRDSDIDPGGSEDLQTKDGLSLAEIVIKTLTPREYKKLARAKKVRTDQLYYQFLEIQSSRWGWC